MQVKFIITYNKHGYKLTGKNSYIFYSDDIDRRLSNFEELEIVYKEVPRELINYVQVEYPKFVDVQIGDKIYMRIDNHEVNPVTRFATVIEKADMAFRVKCNDQKMWINYHGQVMNSRRKSIKVIDIVK